MPEHSRILAPADDELLAHMVTEPLILGHLFELLNSSEAGFELPPPGLVVVRVPDEWWGYDSAVQELGPEVVDLGTAQRSGESPWLLREHDGAPAWADDSELRRRFQWLGQVVPSPGLVSWLRAAAVATGTPMAYYHRREHGDDLYYEMALLFDSVHGQAETSLLVRQTFLVDTEDDEECVCRTAKGRSSVSGSAFATALEHIGAPSRIQYFPPDDSSSFDWDHHRVEPRDHVRRGS